MEKDLFEKESIPKAYFMLALPVVFSMVISLVYNMVDTYFIAQTQETNLVAGVSLCAPVFSLMIALGDIFGLGGSSVISRLFGQQKEKEGKGASGFCFYGALVCGCLVAVLMTLFKNPILQLLGVEKETYTYAASYYQFLALGAPIIIVNYTPSNILRTEGLATASMVGTVCGALMNIILDPIFIFGLDMGAGGAAIATVLGTLFSDVVLVWFVIKKSKKLTVSIKETSVNKKNLLAIFAIGIPASITNLMQSFGMAFTNRYLAGYGTDKVAALGIAMKVNMIVLLVLVGFAFGAQPLVGYNYGAKNEERLKKIIGFSLVFVTGLAVVMAVVLAVLAPTLIGIFMKEPAIIEAGSQMLRFLLLTIPAVGMILVFTTVFQSEGRAVDAFLLSLGRQGIFLIISMLVLSHFFGYMGVITAQALADVLTVLLAVVLFSCRGKREH